MAMKKYRIVLGICGPTILKSNMIKANSKEEAVIKYLNSENEEVSEENINKYLKHVYEVTPSTTGEKKPVTDILGKEIKVGNKVGFIRNHRGEPTRLLCGEVTKVSDKSVEIKVDNSDSIMKVAGADKDFVLGKVVVLDGRKNTKSSTERKKDASGYPINVGDHIVFMDNVYSNASKTFVEGDITDISEKTIVINNFYRRSFDRFIVIK